MVLYQTTSYFEVLSLGQAPYHRYKDNRKRDMNMAGLDINNRETAASNRDNWRPVVTTGMTRAEERKGHICLRGGYSESRYLPMLLSHHIILCVSATFTQSSTCDLDLELKI